MIDERAQRARSGINVASAAIVMPRLALARRISRAAFLAFVGATIFGAIGALFPFGHWASPLFALVPTLVQPLVLGAFITSYVMWMSRGTRGPGAIMTDATTVQIATHSQSRLVSRASITSAYVLQGPRVEIVLADGDVVTALVATEEEARALVDDLGFGPNGASVTIDTAEASRRWFHVLIGLGVYWGSSMLALPLVFLAMAFPNAATPITGVLSGPLMMLLYPFFRSYARAPQLTIGEDGVLWTAGRKKRFLPRGKIRGVEQTSPAMPLVIHTDEGPVIVRGAALDAAKRTAAGRLVYERIVTSERAQARDRADAFDRAGRSPAEWKLQLQQTMTGGDASYRASPATTEDAANVLKSAVASREQRLGAAVALRIAGEPIERIRVAVATSADDDLRAAVEAATEEAAADEAGIEKALRRLSR